MPSGFRGFGEAVSLHDPRVHRCLLARRLRRRRRWGLAGQRRGQMLQDRKQGSRGPVDAPTGKKWSPEGRGGLTWQGSGGEGKSTSTSWDVPFP